jgi:O-methyltransferase
MLDADLFAPTLAGLTFFYQRVTPGGYIFIHDFNSPESDWAVSRAIGEFMKDKPERIVEIPDMGGSVLFRKI